MHSYFKQAQWGLVVRYSLIVRLRLLYFILNVSPEVPSSVVVEASLMVSSTRDWLIELTVGGSRLGLLLSVHFLRGVAESSGLYSRRNAPGGQSLYEANKKTVPWPCRKYPERHFAFVSWLCSSRLISWGRARRFMLQVWVSPEMYVRHFAFRSGVTRLMSQSD